MELRKELRDRYAARLGTKSEDVAITSSTSEGIARTINGLDLRAGDVILTSTDEHPGLLGPLASARDRHGVELELAAWDDLPDAVRAETALVACSHSPWLAVYQRTCFGSAAASTSPKRASLSMTPGTCRTARSARCGTSPR